MIRPDSTSGGLPEVENDIDDMDMAKVWPGVVRGQDLGLRAFYSVGHEHLCSCG